MTQSRGKLVSLAAFLLLLMQAWSVTVQAQEPASQVGEMSVWRAKSMLAVAGKYAFAMHCGGNCHFYLVDIASIQITSTNELRFTATNDKSQTVHFLIALKYLPISSSACNEYWCNLTFQLSKGSEFKLLDEVEKKSYSVTFDSSSPSYKNKHPCSTTQDRDACLSANKLFAAALNGLRAYALSHSASAGDFHQQAAAWRSLPTKPPLSEGARIHRLLAEEAVGKKQLDEALNHYELGVDADPTWATGWHNAAVLAGELGYYADAAHHMQNYLELVPDAEDAQAARDSLDIWKYKAAR